MTCTLGLPLIPLSSQIHPETQSYMIFLTIKFFSFKDIDSNPLYPRDLLSVFRANAEPTGMYFTIIKQFYSHRKKSAYNDVNQDVNVIVNAQFAA